MKIDSRSLGLGILLGGSAALGIGAVANSGPGPVGKYQVALGPEIGKIVVIDTTTGKCWRGVHQGVTDPGWAEPK